MSKPIMGALWQPRYWHFYQVSNARTPGDALPQCGQCAGGKGMRALPRQRIMDAAIDHQFIRPSLLDQRAQPFPHPLRPTGNSAGHHLLKHGPLMARQPFDIAFLRFGQQPVTANMQIQHPRRCELAR